jgi:hypothetical protein
MRVRSAGLCLLLAGCTFDLDVPPRRGPAVINGIVVVAVPGKTTLSPVENAVVELSGTGKSTLTNAQGFFELSDFDATRTLLGIKLDSDKDGTPERQKTIDLKAFGLKPGHDLALGEVVLGRNASVTGKVLRGDRPTVRTGHGGSTVFVPEAPFATTTADDGSFTLNDLPEGPCVIAYFRPGFEVVSQNVELRSGEELKVSERALAVSNVVAAKGSLKGRLTPDGAGAAQVTLLSGGQPVAATAPDTAGAFEFQNLDPGLYDLTAVRPGSVSLVLRNVFVSSGSNQLAEFALAPGQSVIPDAGALVPMLDGGFMSDGGLDPGPPAAFVNPPILYYVANGSSGQPHFEGGALAGLQPVRFAWTLLDGGSTLVPGVSEYSAGLDLVLPPVLPERTVVQLVITDIQGRPSPPVQAVLQAAERPIADINSELVFQQGKLTLDAVGSSDPLGLPLIEYQWKLTTGTGIVSLAPGGSKAMVTALAIGSATVELVVKNSFGIESFSQFANLNVTAADLAMGGDGGPNNAPKAFLLGDLNVDGPLRLQLDQQPDVATIGLITLKPTAGGAQVAVNGATTQTHPMMDGGFLLVAPVSTRLQVNTNYTLTLNGLTAAGKPFVEGAPFKTLTTSDFAIAGSPRPTLSPCGGVAVPGIGILRMGEHERVLSAVACPSSQMAQGYNFFEADDETGSLMPQGGSFSISGIPNAGHRVHLATTKGSQRLYFQASEPSSASFGTSGGDGATLIYLEQGNAWTPLNSTGRPNPNSPWSSLGPIYGAPNGLKALFSNGLLGMMLLDTMPTLEKFWSFADVSVMPSSTIDTSGTEWLPSPQLIAAGTHLPATMPGDLVVAKPMNQIPPRLRMYRNVTGVWQPQPDALQLAASTDQFKDVRIAATPFGAVIAASYSNASGTVLLTSLFNNSTSSVTPITFGAAGTGSLGGYDLIARENSVYLATAYDDTIQLSILPMVNPPNSWTTMIGNAISSPGCTLSSPELAAGDSNLVMIYNQQCATNPSEIRLVTYR